MAVSEATQQRPRRRPPGRVTNLEKIETQFRGPDAERTCGRTPLPVPACGNMEGLPHSRRPQLGPRGDKGGLIHSPPDRPPPAGYDTVHDSPLTSRTVPRDQGLEATNGGRGGCVRDALTRQPSPYPDCSAPLVPAPVRRHARRAEQPGAVRLPKLDPMARPR